MEESYETTLEEAFITAMDASDAYIKQQAHLQALLKEVIGMSVPQNLYIKDTLQSENFSTNFALRHMPPLQVSKRIL